MVSFCFSYRSTRTVKADLLFRLVFSYSMDVLFLPVYKFVHFSLLCNMYYYECDLGYIDFARLILFPLKMNIDCKIRFSDNDKFNYCTFVRGEALITFQKLPWVR